MYIYNVNLSYISYIVYENHDGVSECESHWHGLRLCIGSNEIKGCDKNKTDERREINVISHILCITIIFVHKYLCTIEYYWCHARFLLLSFVGG
jgi:hypothetical protein